jgi:hypothetical protein
MRDTEIEITQPITVEASMTLTIDREQWGKADDVFRKSLIAAEIAVAQREFDRSGTFQPKANSGVSRSLPTMIEPSAPAFSAIWRTGVSRARRTISSRVSGRHCRSGHCPTL